MKRLAMYNGTNLHNLENKHQLGHCEVKNGTISRFPNALGNWNPHEMKSTVAPGVLSRIVCLLIVSCITYLKAPLLRSNHKYPAADARNT